MESHSGTNYSREKYMQLSPLQLNCMDRKLKILSLTLFMMSISACTTAPEYVEEDFGVSVRQMVEAQIYDMPTAINPGDIPPEIIDGVVVSETVQGYREEAKRKDEAANNVIFELGSN